MRQGFNLGRGPRGSVECRGCQALRRTHVRLFGTSGPRLSGKGTATPDRIVRFPGRLSRIRVVAGIVEAADVHEMMPEVV
jgi:hypothetical protein